MIECGFAVENIVTIPYCVKDCYDNRMIVGNPIRLEINIRRKLGINEKRI